jgi:Flp pilus assembly protein TadD
MSATQNRHLHRTLLLAGVSALALAVGACSGALKESAEKEAKNDNAAVASLVRIGDASRAGGDLQTAVGFYERASIAAPNDAATQMRLATALLEMGSYGEAETAYRRVLAADPGNIEAMRGLGNIYIATDRSKEAIEQFQAAIAKKASYQAFNGLGVAFDLEGKHAAAQKAYHEGLAENATSLTLQNNLALSLALAGDYRAAVDLLQRINQNPQATLRHRQNLALVYGLAGDTTHAAEVAKMDLDAKAVESNLAYYAWLRAQPKLSPSDVMRYSGPEGKNHPKTPAIEEGALKEKTQQLDIDATASTEPVEGVRPVNGVAAHAAALRTAVVAAPRRSEPDRVAAVPRVAVIEDNTVDADTADDVASDDADSDDAGVDKNYVLLPEERQGRVTRAAAVIPATPRPATRPTLQFRDMSYVQFAQTVGIYGAACEDDYKRGKAVTAHGPAEMPVVDRSKPVVAAVEAKIVQPTEPVEQVAYRIDSTITLEGLRRY